MVNNYFMHTLKRRERRAPCKLISPFSQPAPFRYNSRAWFV
jgi:hypothetical protein